MTRVLGIDPSLTGTGLALIDTEDRLVVKTWTIQTKGHRDDSIESRRQRIVMIAERHIGDAALGLSGGDPAGLAVIEYPTLSQGRQGGHLDRHGLWWLAVHRLAVLGVPTVAVPASTRAKYATGKGNASKDTVLLEVARRYPHARPMNNNEADALILAAMGARHLGAPIDDLPLAHLTAMGGVRWPTTAAA